MPSVGVRVQGRRDAWAARTPSGASVDGAASDGRGGRARLDKQGNVRQLGLGGPVELVRGRDARGEIRLPEAFERLLGVEHVRRAPLAGLAEPEIDLLDETRNLEVAR